MTGLNFDAIPAISSPIRFYLTAPVFALLAAMLIALHGETLWLSRWMPATLAITHLIALGVMAMVMIGSLFQVMPVLCGAAIPITGWKLHLFHATFASGVLALAAAFLGWLSFLLPFVLLGLSLGYFALTLAWLLITQAKGEQTRMPILLAVLAFVSLVIIGLVLLGGYLWGVSPTAGKALTNLHAGFGSFGWIILLVMAVSFQVIPMFHVTPAFGKKCRNSVIIMLVIGLVVASFDALSDTLGGSLLGLGGWLLCITAVLLYCLITLKHLTKRKRKLPDVVINYWQIGLTNLMLACALLLWLILPVAKPAWTLILQTKLEVLLGFLFGFGFVLAIIQGMLLKIVPFLISLHLQRLMMKNPMAMIPLPDHYQLISRVRMKRQFYSYLILLLSLWMALVLPITTPLMALTFAVNWLGIAYNLYGAITQYREYRDKLRGE
ncbi:hypothetical protein QWZ04_05175 [Vibrio tapetis subsp. quintayensis]|uniref:hypothetical protein n=1 Tax=Vibrio tapetis TaxID=52443 RepID=UPI0025B4D289|nr:hypothetical protein [Vibrio tapetis]MDN3679717.1 hypothetical protein [Vibrio tapetis subsp. quintayensis]